MPTSIQPAVESFFARFEHASRMLEPPHFPTCSRRGG